MSAEIDSLPVDENGSPVSPSTVPPPKELLDIIALTKSVPALVAEQSRERFHRKVAWVTRLGVILMYVWKIIEMVI